GSFKYEQSDPGRFYRGLADDTVVLVDDLYRGVTGRPLAGTSTVDVGGGAGYFADAFAAVGSEYVSIEYDASEMNAAGLNVPGSVRGSGLELPIATDSIDVTMSSN